MIVILLLSLLAQSEAFTASSFLQDISAKWINQTQLKTLILKELENETDNLGIYLKMFDASTKIPSGLLAGSFIDLGNFDECYDIHSNDIYGKYCLGIVPLDVASPAPTRRNYLPPEAKVVFGLRGENDATERVFGLGGHAVGFYWAICVPSTLKAKDIIAIPDFYEEFCYSKDKEPSLSTGAVLTIATLAFFVGIALVSTAYDLYLHYTKQKVPHEMLIAFSYFSNGQKLLKTNNHPDHLSCLNGIRAISMMWVIISHAYSSNSYAPVMNFFSVQDWAENPWNMFINGATVSVDTFFTIAGLVTVYTFLNSIDKGHKFNIFMFYIHRYLRLTPALGIAILIYYNLLIYFGNGPLWAIVNPLIEKTCATGWWSTLLYIGNYIKQGICVGQVWYLQVDMQLFFLSPLILLPLIYWRKWAYVELSLLTLAGIVIPFCLAYFDGHKAPAGNSDGTFDYYQGTYARFGPYVIGMIAGLLIHQMKKTKSQKISIWLALTLWVGGLGLLFACLFAGHGFAGFPPGPAADDLLANAFFLGLNRNGWALGVCLVVYLCVAGYGGPVDLFLAHPIFQFLSKISYTMYLYHIAVVVTAQASSKTLVTFSNSQIMFDFWGYFMITAALSVILCLTFESPIIIIEKWIFGRRIKTTQQAKDKDVEILHN